MSLSQTFSIYLKTQGVSKVTFKNYVSDVNHFLAWAELYTKGHTHSSISIESPEFLSKHFNHQMVADYRNFLIANLPISTANRRLSTLRAFAKFCLKQAWIASDPTKETKNIKTDQATVKNVPETENNEILIRFRRFLEKDGATTNTIKNYLSDIKEFLNWFRVKAVT